MPKAKLKEKGDHKKALADIKKKIAEDVKVLVGIPENATPYPDGTSVAMVGAIHEFGYGSSPERSFLRSTISEERSNIQKDLNKVAKEVVDGKLNFELGLNIIGRKYSDKVQKKIIEIDSPPNTDETIRRKGSSNPLVDTGRLNRSITYEVRMGEDA